MKWPFFTYISSTLIFTLLIGVILVRHTPDNEFRVYTAIRIHACDIFKNDRSTLQHFEPGRCSVKRSKLLVGELIDVNCLAEDSQGTLKSFDYKYSEVNVVFDDIYQQMAALKNDSQCHV